MANRNRNRMRGGRTVPYKRSAAKKEERYTSKAFRAYGKYLNWRFSNIWSALGRAIATQLMENSNRVGFMRRILGEPQVKSATVVAEIDPAVLAIEKAERSAWLAERMGKTEYDRRKAYKIPAVISQWTPAEMYEEQWVTEEGKPIIDRTKAIDDYMKTLQLTSRSAVHQALDATLLKIRIERDPMFTISR